MLTTINNFQDEVTFSIESKEELLGAFRAQDQKKLILPKDLKFPLNVRSYFSWKESSAVYTYLVFKKPNWDLPRGIIFKRVGQGDAPTGGLCSWCHSYGGSDDIGMLSVAMTSNISCSYILCHDLRCIEKIEEASARSGKHPEGAIHQLYLRIDTLFESLLAYGPE